MSKSKILTGGQYEKLKKELEYRRPNTSIGGLCEKFGVSRDYLIKVIKQEGFNATQWRQDNANKSTRLHNEFADWLYDKMRQQGYSQEEFCRCIDERQFEFLDKIQFRVVASNAFFERMCKALNLKKQERCEMRERYLVEAEKFAGAAPSQADVIRRNAKSNLAEYLTVVTSVPAALDKEKIS